MLQSVVSKAVLRNTTRVGQHGAAVLVTRQGDSRILSGTVFVASAETDLIRLPDRIRVLPADGTPIEPEAVRRFYLSTSSCDPCPALVEM